MEFADIDTSQFIGREQKLRQIERYKGLPDQPPKFPVMFYRTNLEIHKNRVRWMFEENMPQILSALPNLNPERTRTIAEIHDDPETDPNWGDVQLSDKDRMSTEQLAALHHQALSSIKVVADQSPEIINGFSYRELLIEEHGKQSLEAQLVSFFDKLDGYGEAWHELIAGNLPFAGPCRGYFRRLGKFDQTFPALAPLFNLATIPFLPPGEFPHNEIANQGKLHTKESILIPTQNPHYNFWKEVTIKRGGEYGINQLITRIESYGDIH